MLDPKIKTFLAVCSEMSFTKAAHKLCMTQPAVTQQIKALEAQYGCKLFERAGRAMKLTRAGDMLKQAALTMRNDEMHLTQRMLQEQDKENYFFGATLTVAEYFLADALPKFINNHPTDTIEMQVANTSELTHALNLGHIDFAIVEGEFSHPQYQSLSFGKQDYVCVASDKYPVDSHEALELHDLLDNVLVTREKGSGTRSILDASLDLLGYDTSSFKNTIELGNIGAIKNVVENTNSISFLYKAAIKKELEAKLLKIIDVEGFPITHEISFIWRRGSIHSDKYTQTYKELLEYTNN